MKTKTRKDRIDLSNDNPLLVSTRVKILLVLLVGFVLVLLAVYIANERYMNSLTNRVETMSSLLNSEQIESLIKNDNNARRNEALVKRQLQQTKGVNTDIQFLYIMAITPDNTVYFLVDSEAPGSDDYSPRGEVYPEASEGLKASFFSRKPFIEGPVTDKWGTWLSVSAPIYDDTGRQIAVIGMDIDAQTYYSVLAGATAVPITGSVLLIIAFLATDTIRRHRQESVRMRSQLVSIASHELRTPLTGIRWGEETLLRERLKRESRDTLQSMYDSTLRLQESIEDILQLANIQAGKHKKLNIASTDITALLSGIFATQKLPAAQQNISLEFDSKWPEHLVIDCDQQRMKRVFNNLISNAIKYSKPGTAVVLSHQLVDGNHVISIRDHGIGIPTSEQDKVFAGFYRATNAQAHEAGGTGMGLYMSRSTIEQHGGKLWLTSTEGEGTTVYVRLPATPSRKKRFSH